MEGASSETKPQDLWEPSQKGLLADWPQRQRATAGLFVGSTNSAPRESISRNGPSITSGPWGRRRMGAALRALCVAGGGRRIECLLDDTTHVARTLPRLMQLIRDFSHVLVVRQADPHAPRPDHACVLANRHDVVFRADKNAPQGALHLDDPARAIALHQAFEAQWQRAQAPLSATTLGL